MDEKPRVLTAAEIEPLRKRAQAHLRTQAETNVARVVKAYQDSPDKIGEVLEENKQASSGEK